MLYILLICLIISIIITGILIRNYFTFEPLVDTTNTLKNDTLLSVCIPARNEEKNLSRCLRSILFQNYKKIEICVMDDHSDDKTWHIMNEYQTQYPDKVRIFKSSPKPDGWLGKSWACHQLSKQAKGDYFIFIDADTWMDQGVLIATIQQFKKYKLDSLTVWPQQITKSFWEKVLIPMLYYVLLGFLITDYVTNIPKWIPAFLRKYISPLFAAANGQFIAFSKDVYQKIGGHEVVKHEIVEDVELSRIIKRSGFRLRMFHGIGSFYCRMYNNRLEIRDGFRKNFLAGFHYNIFLFVLAGIFHIIMYILPVVLFVYGLISSHQLILSLSFLVLALTLFQRILLADWFKWNKWYAFSHPLGVLWFQYLGILSVTDYLLKRNVNWKGRSIKLKTGSSHTRL